MRHTQSNIFSRLETTSIIASQYIPSSWKQNNPLNPNKNSPEKKKLKKRKILGERKPDETPVRRRLTRNRSQNISTRNRIKRSHSKHLKIPELFKKENIQTGNFKPFRPSFTFVDDDPRIKRLEEELKKSVLSQTEGKMNKPKRNMKYSNTLTRSYSKPPSSKSQKLREDRIAYEKKILEKKKRMKKSNSNFMGRLDKLSFQKEEEDEEKNSPKFLELDFVMNKQLVVRTQQIQNYQEFPSPDFTKSDQRNMKKKINEKSPLKMKFSKDKRIENSPSISSSNYETEYNLYEESPQSKDMTIKIITNSPTSREFRFKSKLLIMNEADNTERIPVFNPNEFIQCNYQKKEIVNIPQDSEKTKREETRQSVGYTTLQEFK